MKTVLYGATGMIGRRIEAELKGRGHEVAAPRRAGNIATAADCDKPAFHWTEDSRIVRTCDDSGATPA